MVTFFFFLILIKHTYHKIYISNMRASSLHKILPSHQAHADISDPTCLLVHKDYLTIFIGSISLAAAASFVVLSDSPTQNSLQNHMVLITHQALGFRAFHICTRNTNEGVKLRNKVSSCLVFL